MFLIALWSLNNLFYALGGYDIRLNLSNQFNPRFASSFGFFKEWHRIAL